MSDAVEANLGEVSKRETFEFPMATKIDLKMVDRSPGRYKLWELSPAHKFQAGETTFEGPGTYNQSLSGSLDKVTMGGTAHIYLLSDDDSDKPTMCFIGDAPIANVAQVKEQLSETVKNSSAVPFIQDKKTGLSIIPVSSSVRKQVGETLHVGHNDQHRDLLIYPLLTRDLLGEESILTRGNLNDYASDLTREVQYGDILQTGAGILFTSLLAKDYSPHARALLTELGLVTYDNLPVDAIPAIHQWYDKFKSVLHLSHPRDLLKQYLSKNKILTPFSFGEFIRNAGVNDVLLTPGLWDAFSVDQDGNPINLDDESKLDILDAAAEGYDPSTGLLSRAAVLYRHPSNYNQGLCVVGGSHPEVELYVKTLSEKAGCPEPIEIAQLAGTVFFEKPDEINKTDFGGSKTPPFDVRVEFDTLQNTRHIDVNVEDVRKFLDTLEVIPNVSVKVTQADSLREKLKPPSLPAN